MFQINNFFNFEALMRDNKISKKQIADALGVTQQWIGKLLSKPTKELTLEQLQTILDVIGYRITVVLDRN